MLRIGYVRLHDEGAEDDTAALKMGGCHVIRAEEPLGETHVLDSILDFIADGDELVVSRIEHLASSSRRLLDVLDKTTGRLARNVPLNAPRALGVDQNDELWIAYLEGSSPTIITCSRASHL